jgi:hypothetical protein
MTLHATSTLTSPPRTRSRAARFVLAMVAMLQLLVTGVVPLTDSKAPSTIGAHVEQYGGRQHYVHDEALCLACSVRHLVGDVPRAPAELPATTARIAVPRSAPIADPSAELRRDAPPRAPPAAARIA